MTTIASFRGTPLPPPSKVGEGGGSRERATAAPLAPKATPAPTPTPKPPSGLWHRLCDFVAHVANPDVVWRNPAAKPAPKAATLRVATYNIMLGGQKIDEVEKTLVAQRPDVVLIQEASDEAARRLATTLGLHMTYVGSRFHPRGKAILSRFPIEKAEEIAPPGNGLVARVKAFVDRWKHTGSPIKSIEPLQGRTALHAQVKVGGKTVHLVDVHHSLAMTDANTAQVKHLAALAKGWAGRGDVVIAGGDFNTNFNLAKAGKADAKGDYTTPTDTPREFADRHDGWTAGNGADAANLEALEALKGTLQDAWTAPVRTVVTAKGALTPEQAREALKALKPGTPAFKAMLLAADGVSQLGGKKRFDNVLVSPNARVAAATVDQTATGSDHQPVYADVVL